MKKKNILKWIILAIALAINIFILVNAFINGEASAEESNKVAHTTADFINTVKPDTITQENFPKFAFDIRKLFGHYGLFVLSGSFSSWALYLFLNKTKVHNLIQIAISLIFGFALACLSEFVQVFTDGRTGAWTDVGIDSGGYLTGFLLVILIIFIRNLVLKKKQEKMKN